MKASTRTISSPSTVWCKSVEAGGDDEPRRAARDERAVLGRKDCRGEGVADLLGHLVHGHLVGVGLRRWPVTGLGGNAGPDGGLGSVRGS
jgi:hypothetical protein